jgi:hypothetical protein
METYSQFVTDLKAHLESEQTPRRKEWIEMSERFVDGLAADELRKLVDIEIRRKFGAFFTSSEMSTELIRFANIDFNLPTVFYDPACGAGNLLLAALKEATDKNETTILGTDLHQEFLLAAELRVNITERLLAQNSKIPAFTYNFNIQNGLENNVFYTTATHIITNPPFNLMQADKSSSWAKGMVSAAGLFIDRIVAYSMPGTKIVAILPDVLRSGSRYAKWRAMVEENCLIHDMKMLGQFDQYADVDVFALSMTKCVTVTKNAWHWSIDNFDGRRVKDLFKVSVGPVVDNRDPYEGEILPYLVSRGLVGWKEVEIVDNKRPHKGKSVSGPFVVVKRTSRMGDANRAIASIINSTKSFHIDNHLIVLKPISGKISDCRKVLRKLQSKATDAWLDEQIRCRHLTVKIVSNIPL